MRMKLYLEGRALWNLRRTGDAYKKFREAISVDADHWLAQAYLAVTGANAIRNSMTIHNGRVPDRAQVENAPGAGD